MFVTFPSLVPSVDSVLLFLIVGLKRGLALSVFVVHRNAVSLVLKVFFSRRVDRCNRAKSRPDLIGGLTFKCLITGI